MARIEGQRDGENERNEHYTVWGRGTVSRQQLVMEVAIGMHPRHHNRTIDGQTYVVDNPDHSKKDNVNQ
ncbi:MAG: DUF3892 domain-containing protein [Patescibacteria group bacterium]|nr:DUF3892 domain-containing protein [Patescibacteria group bacterium]